MNRGIDALQLLQEVVRPALAKMNEKLPDMDDHKVVSAEQIVMGTAALESRLVWLRQHGNGPARGLWQMEPATFYDLLLRCNGSLRNAILKMSVADINDIVSPDEMCWNLRFAAAMCRLKYRDDPHPLPQIGDVQGMERLHKRCYNSILGATQVGQFTRAWTDIIEPRYNQMWPAA